ncbi:hemerythrin domain-containing protein [Aequorivita sp. H23M31]|uniref:Hemerythrin domain-containing protein n=1 Tax=Aequorivita ciconiae TaxID=2494375 RepID=A0A410G6S4_9FLAO|nr:hemerythrin domain-containing protein [Aequorivita sp. H23M31]QAA82984.1 hemerythrin domain-containing protein [Aequorivita sp. H23M31]
MKKKNPKQHLALTPIIEEHNEVILLCERIRFGLKNDIAVERIKKYVDWFKEHYLDPHFEIEKEHIFPILGINNVRVKRALANHRRLSRLLSETTELNKVLNKIEEELSTYIGFEERVLYNEIREIATPQQWEEMENNHQKLGFSEDGWEDKFWKL